MSTEASSPDIKTNALSKGEEEKQESAQDGKDTDEVVTGERSYERRQHSNLQSFCSESHIPLTLTHILALKFRCWLCHACDIMDEGRGL